MAYAAGLIVAYLQLQQQRYLESRDSDASFGSVTFLQNKANKPIMNCVQTKCIQIPFVSISYLCIQVVEVYCPFALLELALSAVAVADVAAAVAANHWIERKRQ